MTTNSRHPYGSNVPLARDRLAALADQMRADGIASYAEEIEGAILPLLYRTKAARRGPIKKNPVTPQIMATIRKLAAETDLHADEIAARVGVNPGRVSEIIHGGRRA